MSTESRIEPIQTATVGIFSPDLEQTLLVYNAKLDGLVPPGGKYDKRRDITLVDTAIHEVSEETWILLFHGTGVFLDGQGMPIRDPWVISEMNFPFPDGQQGHDSLYLFRLHEMPRFQLKTGSHWLHRKQYAWERVEIPGDRMYQFRALDIRDKILQIMN